MSRHHNHPLAGRRIELLSCSDPYTRLNRGDLGTIDSVDDAGTYHVNWDSGARLGLIEGEDSWRVLPAEDRSRFGGPIEDTRDVTR